LTASKRAIQMLAKDTDTAPRSNTRNCGLGRLRLLRVAFAVLPGLRLDLVCTPAGMPILWALADPRIGEREVLARDAGGRWRAGARAAGPAADQRQWFLRCSAPSYLTGRPPCTVLVDRGFGTTANDLALAELGSSGSACNGPGSRERHGVSTNRAADSGACATGESVSRPRISHLKRSFGFRRTRLRRLAGAQTWAGLGIFAYNLQRMTVLSR
jgi:transposase, IS5 family